MEQMKNKSSILQSQYEFFEKSSAEVEVLDENWHSKIFYFPLLPICKFYFQDMKDEFLYNVNRDNAQSKCAGLHAESYLMIIGLRSDYYLRNLPFFGVLYGFSDLWKKMLFYLSVIINIFFILSYTK